MKRRAFLSLLACGASAAALPGKAKAAGGEFKGHPDNMAILTDLTLCIGCRKCESACATVNALPAPVQLDDRSVFKELRRTHADSFTVVNRYEADGKEVYRKTQCMHCQEPACASACFVRAFTKNPDGSVTYDPSLCVGCRYCMVACPFNIPAYTYGKVLSPVVRKCTMCHDRQKEGKLPGCVEACPTGALVFGKRSEVIAIARKRILEKPEKYIHHIYGEHEMGGTAWMFLSGVDFSKVGLREDLGSKPAAEYTAGVLGALPMVVGFWPIVLGGAYFMNKRKEEMAREEQGAAVKAAVEQERLRGEAAAKKALDKAAENARREKDRAVEAAKKELREEMLAAQASAAPSQEPAEKEGK